MSSEQIQELKEEIWRRARKRAEEILRNADEEAKRIIDDAKRRAETMLKSKIEPEKLLIRRRIIGKAISDGRKIVALAKNEIVEKAFQRALEKLRADAQSKSEEYTQFLLRSLEYALSKLSNSNGDLLVYANESDTELLKNYVNKISHVSSSKIRFERADIMGGMIVSDSEGRKTYYGSLEGKVESLKPVLREKVASILFKEVDKG